MDAKTLAKSLPAYGQQAVRTALNALSAVGHLRRVRETIGGGRTQRVFRTYFSRTAREDAWWARFLAGSEAGDGARKGAYEKPAAMAPPAPQAPPAPKGAPRSAAYQALAALGCANPRMTLSAAECAALESLAAEWFARGATPAHFAAALTAGLPPEIHSPGALARSRLRAKLPPEPAAPPAAEPPPPRRLVECTNCGRPGRPENLPGGLCRACRGELPARGPGGPTAVEIHAHVARLRAVNDTQVKPVPDGDHDEIIMWVQEQCMQHRPDVRLYRERRLKVEGYRRGRAIPDGALAPRRHFTGHGEWSDPDGVLMVVEVTSHDSDTDRRDRREKRDAYAGAEIPVYLLVDREP
ncbi:Uma2 family endonuclease [Streptomyces sp. LX-29]|uniref:Uma2 family endonuclease n=1 Tax=Streptomyces sp. LX-29 TaxID=2900152 RepID=UPI00240DE64A|nr:Uma2 family endonuclease [Streptomyces sp. LX-29]WFB08925.1 Uma2 family endonuclease [Streptomyces sp. LX-29]